MAATLLLVAGFDAWWASQRQSGGTYKTSSATQGPVVRAVTALRPTATAAVPDMTLFRLYETAAPVARRSAFPAFALRIMAVAAQGDRAQQDALRADDVGIEQKGPSESVLKVARYG